ncbi:hypothetical protein [Pleurocapsa sp. PCC 7319]|uniref:hypothetical protein n=1 Tax=Pleurocapsa sp. PCC 7319 TaxID=118161 RepID=UPI000348A5FD|nr:hypothetical protein [Pleurocapsa sp. PCC 7319]
MATNLNWYNQEIADLTLQEVYQKANLDRPGDIPRIIRLFENPQSPIALPGKISLHNHDCLHILLGRGVTSQDEAFVIGFTMGNDSKTKLWHIKIFKFLSRFIYPSKYRFTLQEMKIFDLGFKSGRNLPIRNINQVNFTTFYDCKINYLRSLFSIDITTAL